MQAYFNPTKRNMQKKIRVTLNMPENIAGDWDLMEDGIVILTLYKLLQRMKNK
jgi:hypothetical protein